MSTPTTLQEAIQNFANFENCRAFMVEIRWPNGAVQCPYCGSEKVTYLAKARVYRCYGDHPRQKFSLKVGTIFETALSQIVGKRLTFKEVTGKVGERAA